MEVVGQQLGGFSLQGVGRTITFNDYRGRRNLVIMLLAGEGREAWRSLLVELANRYPEIRELTAEVIAVFPDEDRARQAEVPFPVAWDPGGAFLRRYGLGPAGQQVSALLVTDRYGEVYQYDLFDPAAPSPQADQVLNTLLYIEKQCPECGAPVWQAPG